MAFYSPPSEGIETVIKTADETVNNSNTLQDDDELNTSVSANETLLVEAFLLVDFKSASDLKIAWSAPALCTGYHPAISATDVNANGAENHNVASTRLGTTSQLSLITDDCLFINGANAGTVKLQWAQNTAVAEDTIVKAGSLLRVTRL